MSGALPESASISEMTWAQSRFSLTAFTVGFFFSFRSVFAMISARWLGMGSEPGVIAMFLIECALLLMVIFQAAGPAERPLRWMMQQASTRWVLLFLAFSCASLLWSATVSRPASFLYWCGMTADVAIVALLVRSGAAGTISCSLMRGFVWSTSVLACIAWLMPATSDHRLGDPDYFNTNQIGNLCAMGIFMAQFLAARGDAKRWGTIWLLTITLMRSLSKTTMIAFVLAEATLMFGDKSMSARKKIAIACVAVVLIAVCWGLIGSYFDDYASGGQAQSLTGRTGIWAYTLGVALDKPWFGNGMDAMWKVFPPFGRDMFEARHAENELLQQFFAFGLMGVVMLVGTYASLWRSIRSLQRGTPKAVMTGIMVFVVVRGLAEAEPFDLLLPLWMITLMSGIVTELYATREERRSSFVPVSAGLSANAIPGSSLQ